MSSSTGAPGGVLCEDAREAAQKAANHTDDMEKEGREVEQHTRAAEILRALSALEPSRANEYAARLDCVAEKRDRAQRRKDDAEAAVLKQTKIRDLSNELARYWDEFFPAKAEEEREVTPPLFESTCSSAGEPPRKRERPAPMPVAVVDSDGDVRMLHATSDEVATMREVGEVDRPGPGIVTCSQNHNQELLDLISKLEPVKLSDYDPSIYACGCFFVEVHY